jgi:hypothetical protein
MFGKFILFVTIEKTLSSIFDMVSYHDNLRYEKGKEIVKEEDVRGGGLYKIENDILYLFGTSPQFGKFTKENGFNNIFVAVAESYLYRNNNLKQVCIIIGCNKKDDFESMKVNIENFVYNNPFYGVIKDEDKSGNVTENNFCQKTPEIKKLNFFQKLLKRFVDFWDF